MKICAVMRDSRHRLGDKRVFTHGIKGHHFQEFSTYVIRPFQFTVQFHEKNRRRRRTHLDPVFVQRVRRIQEMLEIRWLTGEVGEISLLQQ